MYYEHYGLNNPPFKILPDVSLFFAGGERGEILEGLLYAISQGDGIVKVVGEVGSGKTMLSWMVQVRIPETIHIVYLANPRISAEDIFHAIAFEMGLDVDVHTNRLEVMHELQRILLARYAKGDRVVCFVEEAQAMGIETLEEIRLLSNLETQHAKLLQIVLFGQPELNHHLDRRNIRQLRERIVHSFYLRAFSPSDVRGYINFRMRAAGYDGPEVFSLHGYRRIARVSAGLVRRINNIADKALLAAYVDNTHNVTKKHIRMAIRDNEFNYLNWRPGWFLGITAIVVFIIVLNWLRSENIKHWTVAQVDNALHAFRNSGLREANAGDLAPRAATPNREVRRVEKKSSLTSRAAPGTGIPQRLSSLIKERLEATQMWLAQHRAKHFSIQLMLAKENDQRTLERFLNDGKANGYLDWIYLYRIEIDGVGWYRVFFKDFHSLESARNALVKLPQVLKRYKPFIRNFQDTHGILYQ